MASQINATTIDETYPVAGTDNDTQGFRDNFSIIKNGLVQAATEITDLQSSTAKINNDNDFNGKAITNAVFRNTAGGILNAGTRSGAIAVNFANGAYQYFKINGNASFTFEGFPADNAAKITLEIEGDGTARTVTFVSDGVVLLKKSNNVPDPITVTTVGEPIIFDVFTRVKANDPGALTRMIYVNYLGAFTV